MVLKSPNEIALDVAKRFRKVRKTKGITIKELSERSGVPYSTIRRFESTGELSFVALAKLSVAMNEDGQIEALFADYRPSSIEEVIRGNYQ